MNRNDYRNVFQWTTVATAVEIVEGRPIEGMDHPEWGSPPEVALEGPWIVVPDGWKGMSYEPVRRTTLPDQLAEVGTPDQASAFVRRNGFLTYISPVRTPDGVRQGEPFHLWAAEAAYMRRARDLLRAAEYKDTSTLSQAVAWKRNVVEVFGTIVAGDAACWGRQGAFKKWQTGRDHLSGPARAYVADLTNKRLKDGGLSTLVQADHRGRRYLQRPRDLRAAIWLMVARALIDQTGFPPRPCAVCGEPFAPQRERARYCSSACRQKAYRLRSRS